jgi:hypothetical protein
MYPPESAPSSLINRRLLPSQIHAIFALNQHSTRILTVTSVANHQSVLLMFRLTVVSLCILLNLHHFSSHIVAFRPLESASRENSFPLLNRRDLSSHNVALNRHRPRIFTIANHQRILPHQDERDQGCMGRSAVMLEQGWFFCVVIQMRSSADKER